MPSVNHKENYVISRTSTRGGAVLLNRTSKKPMQYKGGDITSVGSNKMVGIISPNPEVAGSGLSKEHIPQSHKGGLDLLNTLSFHKPKESKRDNIKFIIN